MREEQKHAFRSWKYMIVDGSHFESGQRLDCNPVST